jgi:hypothetical protein
VTSKRELLTKKEQELADLKRLVAILDEVDVLTTDLTVEKIIDIAPKVAALTSEADRLIRRNDFSGELVELEKQFKTFFTLFARIYHEEVSLKNDLNRLLRLEIRRQQRQAREAVHITPTMCAFEGCKKPVRVYANELAYCKRHAREEGIILRGKIV